MDPVVQAAKEHLHICSKTVIHLKLRYMVELRRLHFSQVATALVLLQFAILRDD